MCLQDVRFTARKPTFSKDRQRLHMKLVSKYCAAITFGAGRPGGLTRPRISQHWPWRDWLTYRVLPTARYCLLSKLPVLPLVPGQCPDGSSQGCARHSLGVHVELAHVGAVHVVPELKAHGAAAGIGGRDEPRFGVSVVVVRLHVHVVTWNKVLESVRFCFSVHCTLSAW